MHSSRSGLSGLLNFLYVKFIIELAVYVYIILLLQL